MTSRSRLFIFLALLGSTLTAAAVACSSGGLAGNEARITVDGGGELRSDDGSFVLTVPAGAVSEDVTISFESTPASELPGGILNGEGIAYELKPDGLEFIQPAKVTLKLPPDVTAPDTSSELLPTFDLLTVDSDGVIAGLQNVENSYDLETRELELSGELTHFSFMFRTKRGMTISLSNVIGALAIGEPRSVDAKVSSTDDTAEHSVTWQLEALTNLRLETWNAFLRDTRNPQRITESEIFHTGDSAKVSSTEQTPVGRDRVIEVQSNIICIGLGTGLYAFSAESVPTDGRPRPVKMSLTGRVTCIGAAEAAATARTGIDETVRAGGADLVFTPTPAPAGVFPSPTVPASPIPTEAPTAVPVPTATPRASQGPDPTPSVPPGTIQLRVVASTGDIVPGPDLDAFSTFELPQVGKEDGIFFSFNDSGSTGIWKFDQSSSNTTLTPAVTTTSPPENSSFVFLNSESFVTNGDGEVVYIGRLRLDNDFTEGVYRVSESGVLEISLEGESVPGGSDGEEFRQFDTVQITSDGGVLFESPASGGGFWFRPAAGATDQVLIEGQALPGLLEDWRDTSSRRMRSAGVTDSGDVLFFLADYRRTLSGGGEETGGGIWLLKPGGNNLIAQTGMLAPDFTTFIDLFDPSMNASGQVAFHGRSQIEIGSDTIVNEAIWKTGADGGLVKIAEPRNIVGPDNMELVEVSKPIMQPDGRVIFVGTAFDFSSNLISFLLKETSVGLEILARTDSLPTRSGNVSVVPQSIQQIATNRHGAVVFQLDFNGDIWMYSPDGSVDRILGAGDTLGVETAGGTVQKTVSFVEFVGGATTNMGLSTGFSDDADAVMKATFSDGTEAIVLATFTDDLFD